MTSVDITDDCAVNLINKIKKAKKKITLVALLFSHSGDELSYNLMSHSSIFRSRDLETIARFPYKGFYFIFLRKWFSASKYLPINVNKIFFSWTLVHTFYIAILDVLKATLYIRCWGFDTHIWVTWGIFSSTLVKHFGSPVQMWSCNHRLIMSTSRSANANVLYCAPVINMDLENNRCPPFAINVIIAFSWGVE